MIACGMRSRTFGTPGLSEENNAFFLKNLWDARKIRATLIKNFERAANPNINTAERRRLLTVLIVGGGPTSVEFAGELN
jgi:NADH dehydrogenase FAD-containing subunit